MIDYYLILCISLLTLPPSRTKPTLLHFPPLNDLKPLTFHINGGLAMYPTLKNPNFHPTRRNNRHNRLPLEAQPPTASLLIPSFVS